MNDYMGIPDILNQLYNTLLPFAGLIFVLGPLCLAFRKAGVFIGLGVGCIVNSILWDTLDKIPFLSGLAENPTVFLIVAIVILAIFAGIGLTAVVVLAFLFSSIGGLLLSVYLFGFSTWTVIGGFVGGLIWLYGISLLIKKVAEKVKGESKKMIRVEYRPEKREIGICPNCGAEVQAGNKFCSSCGLNLEHAKNRTKKVVKKKWWSLH